MPRFAALLILACAGLCPTIAAQLQVTPANHVLLVTKGKTGSITVKVSDGCTPTWSFDVAASAWFEVSGDTPGPAKSRTYKLKALGPIGGFTTARIDMEGVGADCADDDAVLVRILIVAQGKSLEQQLVGGNKDVVPPALGLAKRFQEFRKQVNQSSKNLATDIKEILAKHAAKAFQQPVQGGVLTQSEIAMHRYLTESGDTVDDLYESYAEALAAMASDGAAVLLANGHNSSSHITAPPAFQPGSGGLWDQWRLRLADELARAATLFSAAEHQFTAKLRQQAQKQGEPFFVVSSPFALRDPGDGLLAPVSGAGQSGLPDLDAAGTSQILRVTGTNRAALNGFFLSAGRIQVHGRARNAESVIVTFQRLDAAGQPLGEVQGNVFAVDADTGNYRITWPAATAQANLAPGTWRVVASGGGTNITSRLLTVPGH